MKDQDIVKSILPSNFKYSTLINRINKANDEAYGIEFIEADETDH